MNFLKSFDGQIKLTIIFSGVGIVFAFVVLYFLMRSFFLDQEVIRARDLANNVLAYQKRVAEIDTKNLKCSHVYLNGATKYLDNIYIQVFSKRHGEKLNPVEFEALDFFKKSKKDEFYKIVPPDFNSNIPVLRNESVFYAKRVVFDKVCLRCHGKVGVDVKKEDYEKLKIYGEDIFNHKVGDSMGAVGVFLPYDKSTMNNIFIGAVMFLTTGFIIGTLIFLRITSKADNFVKEMLKYFKNVAKGIYKPIKEDFGLTEFNSLRDGFNQTIKKIKEYKGELYKKLYYHPLTGLPNREKYFDTLKKVHKPVIIFNVDKFKGVNAYFGPEIGDKLIKEIALRFELLKRDYGFKVYHLSIDEFAILLGATPTKDKLILILQDLLKELERAYIIDGNEIIVKFRVGVSLKDKKYITAEIALDKAKDLKKDIVFGEEVMESQKDYENNLKWFKKLRKALDDDRIVPFYQPIVDRDKKIVKYEALVRMIDEDGKVISPFFFLDIAKKTRTYFEITRRMVDKAFEEFKGKKVGVSLNIDLNDIESDIMREFILQKVNETKDVKVTFEIVESEDVRESDFVKNYLRMLRKVGAEIYVDDFGSGYSNFDYLFKLHPDGIKIDGSLIKDILVDKNDELLVKTIVDFAKKVGIKVVAEFVETEEIFEKLKELGVDYFQGYLFSPPTRDIKEEL